MFMGGGTTAAAVGLCLGLLYTHGFSQRHDGTAAPRPTGTSTIVHTDDRRAYTRQINRRFSARKIVCVQEALLSGALPDTLPTVPCSKQTR
ncbi:unnamed protein product [Colias eurytheme]|nr:unnamed protein product [Colias eurytheme]